MSVFYTHTRIQIYEGSGSLVGIFHGKKQSNTLIPLSPFVKQIPINLTYIKENPSSAKQSIQVTFMLLQPLSLSVTLPEALFL